MGETGGAIGGYLVPLDFTDKLLKVIAEESFIYPKANIFPMSSATAYAPKIDVETAQSAPTPSFFGGVNFTWGFSQAPTETEPKFRSLDLTAWDLLGYAVVSNQWLMDIGKPGEDYLLELFGKAAAWQAEYAFLQGKGAGSTMPLGILNAPALKTVTRSGAGHIAAADISSMAAAMLPFSWKTAIWACSPSALGDIQKLSSYFLNVELAAEKSKTDGLVGMLFTRPLYVTDKLPSLGTQGDLIFFDPSLYVIGERKQVLIDASPYDPTSWTKFQTTFRIWYRCNGKPQLDNTVTLSNGDLVSPYVAIHS
jgi:HK97 family phage major capsid protein